jgi:hypothetical protein
MEGEPMTRPTQQMLSHLIRREFDTKSCYTDTELVSAMIEIGVYDEAEQMLSDAEMEISLMEFIKQKQCK